MTALYALASVPSAVSPEAPPGVQGFLTIVNWVAWIVLLLCVFGFLFSAGQIGFAMRRGEETEGMKGLGLALIGCVLVGGASGILGMMTGGMPV